TDTDGATDTASVTITVEAANTAPTADAGSDQTVTEGDTVTLDGSGSSDAEDDYADLTFSWEFTSDPSGGSDTLSDADTDSPSFTPSTDGDYVVELTVTDTDGATDTASVTITVEAQ
ncbi:MAG: PKD domain-containing protein, partial [Persicimonas sp.]